MQTKHLKNLLWAWAILLLVGCSGEEETPDVPADDDLITFTLLQLNDVYEIAPLEGGKVGGLARVATVKKELEAEGDSVIAILSGDFLSPSLIGNLEHDGRKIRGAHMVDVLNALGLDFVTFGNHEFDIPMDDLQMRMDESDFWFTTCNTFHMTDSGFVQPFQQKGYRVSDWFIKPIVLGEDTVNLGMVGVLLPFNERDWVYYTDVDSSFIATVEDIRPYCDVVVGITHLLIEGDKRLAEKVDDVPLFMGGHDHSNMLEQVGDTRITKADANAKSVYIHRVSVNKERGEVLINSELKMIDESVAEDPEVAAVVTEWNMIAEESLNNMGFDPYEVIGEFTEPMDGRESFVRFNPATLGKFMCRAIMQTDPAVQVGLVNSGSIRVDDVLTGTITQSDILRTLPFGGAIAYADVSGKDLLTILETGTVTNHGSGGYLQIEGAESKDGSWYIGEEEITSGGTYKIVGPEYMMAGKESNLELLGNIKKDQPETVGDGVRNDIRDVIMAYMRAGGA